MVRDHVRERRLRRRELFVPPSHPPRHAQCNFGEAWAVTGGVKGKVHHLFLDLPHGDALFLKAHPADTTPPLRTTPMTTGIPASQTRTLSRRPLSVRICPPRRVVRKFPGTRSPRI